MKKINMRVEFEIQPVRHIAVQCPNCKDWFYGDDITEDKLFDAVDILFAKFSCPICGETFGGREDDIHVEELEYPDVYQDCKKKKVSWE